MKAAKLVTTLGTIALVLSMVMLYTGCEDEPKQNDMDAFFAANPFAIDPRFSDAQLDITVEVAGAPGDTAVIFNVGQVIPIRAKGGSSGYTWFVANNVVGTIAAITDPDVGDSANYTVTGKEDNTVYVLDGHGRAGALNISVNWANATDVEILEGASISLSVGQNATFHAVGGDANFTWASTIPTLGTIDANSGAYIRLAVTGTNIVSVSDSSGRSDSITVEQP